MPIAEHSIGGLQFLCLQGSPQLAQEQLERFSRGGVDGHGFRRLGTRGESFELISIVDAPSLASARSVGYPAYVALVATEPVPLVKDGVAWGNYVVEKVSLAPNGIRAVANFVGGLNPPSLALLVCRWQLIG